MIKAEVCFVKRMVHTVFQDGVYVFYMIMEFNVIQHYGALILPSWQAHIKHESAVLGRLSHLPFKMQSHPQWMKIARSGQFILCHFLQVHQLTESCGRQHTQSQIHSDMHTCPGTWYYYIMMIIIVYNNIAISISFAQETFCTLILWMEDSEWFGQCWVFIKVQPHSTYWIR